VNDVNYEKISSFIVTRLFLGKVRLAFFLRFAFRAVTDAAVLRLRAPLPRNLLIIFCIDSDTCFEIVWSESEDFLLYL